MKMRKSPSLIIDTNMEDFDDGRIPTDVHYESDNNGNDECDLKSDLMTGNLSDRKPRRPLSAAKRSRTEANMNRMLKQTSGSTMRLRGSTPPQLKRNNTNQPFAAQPFMSTTNKRAFAIQAKINDKLEGAFNKPQKKRKKRKKKAEPANKEFSPRGSGLAGIDNDDSPPGEDNERLSKRDDESDESNGAHGSSEGELPNYEVPEVLSEEEEELDTIEI